MLSKNTRDFIAAHPDWDHPEPEKPKKASKPPKKGKGRAKKAAKSEE